MNRSINPCAFYNKWNLKHFYDAYDTVHVHLVLLICPLGLVFNVLNIIILNQKSMKSPTNFLLTLLALSDSTIMALYIIFDLKFLKTNNLDTMTWGWAHYLLFYLSMQNFLHSFSSWNLVALAVFRLIYIRYPHNAVVHCTMNRAKISGLIIVGVSSLISVPYILAHNVIPVGTLNFSIFNDSNKKYMINYTNPQMQKVIFFWTSIFVKSLPITWMTVLTVILISALRQSVMRRKTLLNSMLIVNSPQEVLISNTRSNILQRRGGITKETIGKVDPVGAKKSIKTTRMLIAIVIMYCFSYLPQALMLLTSGVLGQCFSVHVYDKMGNLMDLITLLNACVNFILFCSMSSQYRQTFTELFYCQKQSRFSRRKLKNSQQLSSIVDFQSTCSNYNIRKLDGLANSTRSQISIGDVQKNRFLSFEI